MAWWDHEELKPHHLRSDKYILAFPDEYTTFEVEQARHRQARADIENRIALIRRQVKDLNKELDALQKQLKSNVSE